MGFQPLVITNTGKALLTRGLNGDTITFTRMQMGSGQLGGQTILPLTALVAPVVFLPVASISRSGDNASIVATFSNIVTDKFIGDGATKVFTLSAKPAALTSVTVGGAAATGYTYAASSGSLTFAEAPASNAEILASYNLAAFEWREIGVFAADPDYPNDRTKDILYCYQNAGDEPFSIPAPDPTPYTERITVKIYVAQAQNVKITLSAGVDASSVYFDNSNLPGFTATTLQTAIEEIVNNVNACASKTEVTLLQTTVADKADAVHTHGNLGSDGKMTAAATGAAAGTNIKPVFAGSDGVLGLLTLLQAQNALKITRISTASAALPVAGWSSKAQTVSVSGVTASNSFIVTPAPESYLMWRDCGVYCTAQGAGSLTFACEETPTAALNANILILEVAG